jgi:imidazolonepropionase-like amidohydrolase
LRRLAGAAIAAPLAAFAFAWGAILAAEAAPSSLAIKNVTVIDGTGSPPIPSATVLVSGNRITGVLRGGQERIAATEVIDGGGRFLIPGLWDMHTHLAYAGDVTCTALLAHGVTSVRDPGGSLATIDWLRARIGSGDLAGPRIVRAGPVLDGSKPGVQDRVVVDTAEQGLRAVGFVKTLGVDFIKVHNGTPPEAYFAILAEAKRQGLAVVGHIPYDVDPAAAIDAGHQSVEHIVSLLEGPARRKVAAGMSQEAAIAEFTDEEAVRLARKMVAKKTWFDPTLVTYWHRAHQWETRPAHDPKEKYITGSLRAFWKNFPPPPDKPEVRRVLSEGFDRFVAITGILHREGVRMLVGTDLAAPRVYPGASVHEELRFLVQAGLTPMQALVAGTRNGAESVGRLQEVGTIEAGKIADLVLLDADPLQEIGNTEKIAMVVADGRPLRREALDALLAKVAKEAPAR